MSSVMRQMPINMLKTSGFDVFNTIKNIRVGLQKPGIRSLHLHKNTHEFGACRFQEFWFIKLLVGHKEPPSSQQRLRTSVSKKGGNLLKEAHHCSSLIKAGRGQATQTWDAARVMCTSERPAERQMRERQWKCVSHTHTQEPVKGQRLVLTAQDKKWHAHTHVPRRTLKHP